MKIEEIKDRDIRDGSIHYRMISEKGGGDVEFSITNEDKKMYAYEFHCPGEGRIFLKELENYASKEGLKLIVSNVINPALEHILRSSGYKEYYVEVMEDDVIQCFEIDNKGDV